MKRRLGLHGSVVARTAPPLSTPRGERGKWIAVVAHARRLAGILFAMWRDGVPDDARQLRLRANAAPIRAA